jgi:hypothetical protein
MDEKRRPNMKWLTPLLAIAALSGCVAYAPGDPYYAGSYPNYSGNVTYYGGTYGGPAYRHPYRLRDRDGDGVPNRYDRAPDDPRWR